METADKINKELASALENLMKFVGTLGWEYGGVSKEKWIESYDVLKAAREALDHAKTGIPAQPPAGPLYRSGVEIKGVPSFIVKDHSGTE